jgi:hypothetical protein
MISSGWKTFWNIFKYFGMLINDHPMKFIMMRGHLMRGYMMRTPESEKVYK